MKLRESIINILNGNETEDNKIQRLNKQQNSKIK